METEDILPDILDRKVINSINFSKLMVIDSLTTPLTSNEVANRSIHRPLSHQSVNEVANRSIRRPLSHQSVNSFD